MCDVILVYSAISAQLLFFRRVSNLVRKGRVGTMFGVMHSRAFGNGGELAGPLRSHRNQSAKASGREFEGD